MSTMREYNKQIDARMFDFRQFYGDMAMLLPEAAVIAEVGVANGASAIFLAETLLNLGKGFSEFYLIDNLAYGREDQLRTLIKNVCAANLGHLVEIVPVSSVEGACRFPDRHFDFVFIDASHQVEWTKADIVLWYSKLKQGGILAGHDYNNREGKEVKLAVDTMIPASIPNPAWVAPVEGAPLCELPERIQTLAIIPTDNHHCVWKIVKSDQIKLRTF